MSANIILLQATLASNTLLFSQRSVVGNIHTPLFSRPHATPLIHPTIDTCNKSTVISCIMAVDISSPKTEIAAKSYLANTIKETLANLLSQVATLSESIENSLIPVEDTLNPNAHWSFQIDGNSMDITTPNELMVRIANKDKKLSISILPYSECSSSEPESRTIEVDVSDVPFEQMTPNVYATNISEAIINIGNDGERIQIKATGEGLVVDVWSGNNDPNQIDLLGSVTGVFGDFDSLTA